MKAEYIYMNRKLGVHKKVCKLLHRNIAEFVKINAFIPRLYAYEDNLLCRYLCNVCQENISVLQEKFSWKWINLCIKTAKHQ